MKISLVQGRYFNSWEVLGLGYIGAFLKKHLPNIEINFFQGCFDDDETIIAGCQESDIVAFSCTTPTFPQVEQVATRLKAINPAIHLVVGGYHASSLPEESILGPIDQVVVGEGEWAMLDIVKGNRAPIVIGPPVEFADLPWPDRRLIRNERNIQVAYNDNKKRITSFQSQRACPYSCTYCLDGHTKVMYPNFKKAPLRYRAVSDLLDEMESVTQEYKLDLLKFSDPTWNINQKWVIDFCREKINRKFNVPFYPNIHVNVGSEEMFQWMAKAGCYEIAVGIESGSPKTLKQIGKGSTVEKIRKSVEWAKQANILIRGYFILGMPDETDDDLKMTDQLAEELNLDEYGFTILCPYPGTIYYETVRQEKIDWANADEYSNNFWNGKFLSNAQIKEWQSYFMNKYGHKLTGRSEKLKNIQQQ
ncbi:MAG: B12-binding domain-containing radical SAM protein [Magnetococcus sp. DMHC-6]